MASNFHIVQEKHDFAETAKVVKYMKQVIGTLLPHAPFAEAAAAMRTKATAFEIKESRAPFLLSKRSGVSRFTHLPPQT